MPLLFPNADFADDEKCFAQISMTGHLSDSSTWYKMWEAFTALFAVCGRHIQGGIFGSLGTCTMLLCGPVSG